MFVSKVVTNYLSFARNVKHSTNRGKNWLKFDCQRSTSPKSRAHSCHDSIFFPQQNFLPDHSPLKNSPMKKAYLMLESFVIRIHKSFTLKKKLICPSREGSPYTESTSARVKCQSESGVSHETHSELQNAKLFVSNIWDTGKWMNGRQRAINKCFISLYDY